MIGEGNRRIGDKLFHVCPISSGLPKTSPQSRERNQRRGEQARGSMRERPLFHRDKVTDVHLIPVKQRAPPVRKKVLVPMLQAKFCRAVTFLAIGEKPADEQGICIEEHLHFAAVIQKFGPDKTAVVSRHMSRYARFLWKNVRAVGNREKNSRETLARISGNETSGDSRVTFGMAEQSLTSPTRRDGDVFLDEGNDIGVGGQRSPLLQLPESQLSPDGLVNNVWVIQLRQIFRRFIGAIVNKDDDFVRDILLQDTAQHSLRALTLIVGN